LGPMPASIHDPDPKRLRKSEILVGLIHEYRLVA
jgi:hypothetical protein